MTAKYDMCMSTDERYYVNSNILFIDADVSPERLVIRR